MANHKGTGNQIVVRSIWLLAFLAVSFLLSPVLSADIVIENATGTIIITTPDGQVTTVEAGQPLPAIPSGSTLEVVTGSADISATPPDEVNVLVNNTTATVRDGAKVGIVIDLRTGDAKMNVLEGSVAVLLADGTTQTLTEGAAFSAPAPTPISVDTIDVPGANPAEATGRQGDTQQGLVSGY